MPGPPGGVFSVGPYHKGTFAHTPSAASGRGVTDFYFKRGVPYVATEGVTAVSSGGRSKEQRKDEVCDWGFRLSPVLAVPVLRHKASAGLGRRLTTC